MTSLTTEHRPASNLIVGGPPLRDKPARHAVFFVVVLLLSTIRTRRIAVVSWLDPQHLSDQPSELSYLALITAWAFHSSSPSPIWGASGLTGCFAENRYDVFDCTTPLRSSSNPG